MADIRIPTLSYGAPERTLYPATGQIVFSNPSGIAVTHNIAELRAAVAAYDAVSPPPPPPPAPTPPPVVEVDPVVGAFYSWRAPIGGLANGFTPTQVIKDQTFTAADTALLAATVNTHSGRIYVRCTFIAGRYAAYLQNQRNMAFIDCTFTDSLAPIGVDESCVRLQSCTNILFRRCAIRSYGPKHAFRVHGASNNVSVETMSINSRGNGMMFGRYSTGDNPTVVDLEMKDVTMYCEGPDVLNLSTDGTLRNFRAADFTISVGAAAAGYQPPPAGFGSTLGFSLTNIRRV